MYSLFDYSNLSWTAEAAQNAGKLLFDQTIKTIDDVCARTSEDNKILLIGVNALSKWVDFFKKTTSLSPQASLLLMTTSTVQVMGGIPTLTFEEEQLFGQVEEGFAKGDPNEEILEKLYVYCIGNKKLQRRLENRLYLQKTWPRTIGLEKTISHIRNLVYHTPDISLDNISNQIELLDQVKQTLDEPSQLRNLLTQEKVLHIFHYARIKIPETPHSTPLVLQLKQLQEKAAEIMTLAGAGPSSLPDGTIHILKNTATHGLSQFMSPYIPQLQGTHASLKYQHDASNRTLHIANYVGLSSHVLLKYEYDPNRFDYLEIDFQALMTPGGSHALNQWINPDDQIPYMKKLFGEIVNEQAKLYAAKQSSIKLPHRGAISNYNTLLFKQDSSRLTRPLEEAEMQNQELCSTFVAKFIEEAIDKLNHRLQAEYQKHLEEVNPEQLTHLYNRIETNCLRFIHSPFPVSCNLNKISPYDLAHHFPAIIPSMAHWGKLAPCMS